MKLPSVERLLADASATARRFPFTLAAALVTVVAVWQGPDGSDDGWVRVAGAASLGLPLFPALALWAERHRPAPGWRAALGGAGVVLLALFYWRWWGWPEDARPLRYLHLMATLHFAVAIAAHAGLREPRGFWQFNRILLLRFLLGGVYSAALFIGLAVALAGVDNLLGVSVEGEAYYRLFVTIAIGFQTWFFLAGVPRDVAALDRSDAYPTGLRLFAQYVLLPLVGVYLVILTIYLVQVLVTRSWPSGWIGYLVSALAALGIVALLLIHPERDREGNGWMDRYARIFWVAILPPTAMLLMAAWKRIAQYGITEERYLLTILALWLGGIAIHYAVTRSRGILSIPLTLAVLGLVTWVGPWSAYATAERSQVGRLEGILTEHALLAGGTLTPSPRTVPDDDARQVHDIFVYLIRYHGLEAVAPWFGGSLAAVDTSAAEATARWQAEGRAADIVRYLEIEPEGGTLPGRTPSIYVTAADPGVAVPTDGFEYAAWVGSIIDSRHVVGEDTVRLRVTGPDSIMAGGRRLDVDWNGRRVLELPLGPFLERVAGDVDAWDRAPRSVPREALRIELEAPTFSGRLDLDAVSLQQARGGPWLVGASGLLLVTPAADTASAGGRPAGAP